MNQYIQAEEIKGDLLTIEEVISLFKIKRPTIYNWIRKGKIKPYKIAGYLIRFSKDDLKSIVSTPAGA